MERAKPSSIKRATALRYMGASGWQPDDATTALLDRAEEKILAAATPRAAVRRLPRAGSRGDRQCLKWRWCFCAAPVSAGA